MRKRERYKEIFRLIFNKANQFHKIIRNNMIDYGYKYPFNYHFQKKLYKNKYVVLEITVSNLEFKTKYKKYRINIENPTKVMYYVIARQDNYPFLDSEKLSFMNPLNLFKTFGLFEDEASNRIISNIDNLILEQI